MEQCRRHLRRGAPMLFFPEGTRSPDGKLKAFKDGAFQLAKELKCPVIPIAIQGTANVLPKHGLTLRESMYARVLILAPLDPEQFESVEALRDAARAAIATAMGQ
jgi:1-acyl-sn-glycerol-3-phosphate acyltransferase